MVSPQELLTFTLPIYFIRALVACFSMSANLCIHVWDEMENELPKGGNDFPSCAGTVVLKSIWDRGHYGSNGMDDLKNLQEMGKDCYRRDLLINICNFATCFCLIVTLY